MPAAAALGALLLAPAAPAQQVEGKPSAKRKKKAEAKPAEQTFEPMSLVEEPAPPPPAPVVVKPEPAFAPEPLVAAPQLEQAPEPSGPVGLDVAIKLAVLLPTGNTRNAAALADAASEAGKGLFGSGSVALRYSPPFLDRALSFAFEGGYYRLSGEGVRGFVNDPDFGPELHYSWKIDSIPLLVGVAYLLPRSLPVKLSPVAGVAAVHVSAQSTYQSASGALLANSAQKAWAWGFYLGAEAALPLGPGELLVELRYLNARTDLGFQSLYGGPYNAQAGDVEGVNLLAGYRFAF